MKLFFIAIIFSFVLTPWQLVHKASDYADVSSSEINISGTDDDGKSIKYTYNISADTLKFVNGEGVQKIYTKNEIPLYYRFFFSPGKDSERVNFIVEQFKKAGYRLEEKNMSRSDDKMLDLYVLGTEDKVLYFSAESYHIYKIKYSEGEVLFTEYSQSVKPLFFPGRIEFKTKDGNRNYTFLKKETSGQSK